MESAPLAFAGGPMLRAGISILIAVFLFAACRAETPNAPPNSTIVPASPEERGYPEQAEEPEVPYVPTPYRTVDRMLQLAELDESDTLFDLGSGDGRIVIEAARQYGSRGVGVEIDPVRVAEAEENARRAGVSDRVRFVLGDLFKTDLTPATAVTLYLLPEVNMRLRPKLIRELRPGTPVVSHDFDMGDWQPDHFETLPPYSQDDPYNHYIYFWVVPANVTGEWRWNLPNGDEQRLVLRQHFQQIEATAGSNVTLQEARLRGERISFAMRQPMGGRVVNLRYNGRVSGNRIEGIVEVDGGPQVGRHAWTARR
jgi:hypothetical protein